MKKPDGLSDTNASRSSSSVGGPSSCSSSEVASGCVIAIRTMESRRTGMGICYVRLQQ